MASCIRYLPKRKQLLFDFIDNSVDGDATVFDFDTGNRGYIFQLIKRKGYAYGYFVPKWYYRSGPLKPFVRMNKEYVQWLVKYKTKAVGDPRWDKNTMGSWQEKVKAFFKCGLFPEYNAYYVKGDMEDTESHGYGAYRGYSWNKNQAENHNKEGSYKKGDKYYKEFYQPLDGDGVSVRWVRNAQLVGFCGEETPIFHRCKFDYNGKLLSPITKEAKKLRDKTISNDRAIINRNNRANYANTKIVRYLRQARESGDWSKLNVKDIFTLRNVTHRTELINYFGMERIINELEYDLVDKDTINNNIYELLSVVIPDTTPGAAPDTTTKGNYLKMINPTTDEIHIEGVANETSNWNGHSIDTVKKALAWRDGEIDNVNLNIDKSNLIYTVPEIIT